MNNGRDEDRPPAGRAGWGAETGRETANLVRLFGQMMMLPLTVFVYGMDLFVKTMQGVQRTTDEGMDVMMGGAALPPREDCHATQSPRTESDFAAASTSTNRTIEDDAQTNSKETTDMNDTDLSDDKMLKLVRYKIIFIKRDYEVAFPEVEELVAEDLTDTDYTAWKVAEFIQSLNERPVPKTKWGGGTDPKVTPKYPPAATFDPNAGKNGEWVIKALPEDDKRYLRVYYEVLDRYKRESFKYEQRQIEVLEEIRDRL
jgi:hypothetical protein